METKEFINKIKQNFEVMPTRTEVKEFINKNNLDIKKSTDEITLLIVNAYRGVNYRIPNARKKSNNRMIRKEEIQKYLDQGLNYKQIAAALDISPCKLSKLKSAYGLIKVRNMDTPEFREYMKYHTQAEAAKYYNVDASEISRRMKKYGIQGKRNFMQLWIDLKKLANNETLKLMERLEG